MADSELPVSCLPLGGGTILNGPIPLPLERPLSSALNQPSREVTCSSVLWIAEPGENPARRQSEVVKLRLSYFEEYVWIFKYH